MDILGNNQINIVLTAPLLYIENFIIIMPKKKKDAFIYCVWTFTKIKLSMCFLKVRQVVNYLTPKKCIFNLKNIIPFFSPFLIWFLFCEKNNFWLVIKKHSPHSKSQMAYPYLKKEVFRWDLNEILIHMGNISLTI